MAFPIARKTMTVMQLVVLVAVLALAKKDGRPLKVKGTDLPENILTDKGEVTFDFATGKRLPEEMDDGELEGGDHHTQWTYVNQADWSHEYPICEGKNMRQSPIDIITADARLNESMGLEFVDYDQEVEFQAKNTHHSVSLLPIPSTNLPLVRLSWLPSADFELQEIHFHWGDGTSKGSEHRINGQQAAAEMHMVHYKRGIDKTQIGSVKDSVVVVGVLIESDQLEHQKLDTIIDTVSKVNGSDLDYIVPRPENLISLLPTHHQLFYTYQGSLTTPPCYEVVTWVVMSEPVYMSNKRLIELSNFEAETLPGARRKIMANNRNVQPLLDRPVYVSHNTSEMVSPEYANAHKISHYRPAFDAYWRRVEQTKGTIRKAFEGLNKARDALRARIRRLRDQHLHRQPKPSTPPTSISS